jgi:hypothetical protein
LISAGDEWNREDPAVHPKGRPASGSRAAFEYWFHFTNRQRPLFSAMRLVLVHGGPNPFARHVEKSASDFLIVGQPGEPHAVARVFDAFLVGAHMIR